MTNNSHRAGFVTIVGKPNVGKSTLMNRMVGEKLSIITSKAQTTRHRIMGILNGEDFQIVYSDTPGIIQPKYELHKSMMRFVSHSLEDADIILFVTDIYEKYDEDEVVARLNKAEVPVFLLINKVDQVKNEKDVFDKLDYWKEKITAKEIIPISALEGFNIEKVFQLILDHLPVHPAYYDKEELSDKPERFFAAEIIREKIFINYKKEVPYSCQVVITDFVEEEDILRIRAQIFVERDSQKGIIIGKKGEALKKTGTEARIEMEKFFQKKVFLEQHVKVEPDWRSQEQKLKRFGF